MWHNKSPKQFIAPSLQTALLFIAIATGIYSVFFFLAYPNFGAGVAAFTLFPTIVAGWLLGWRRGLLFGLLTLPLNTILLNLVLVEEGGWNVLFAIGGGPGSVANVVISLIAGLMRHLYDRAEAELAERRRTEARLRDREARLQLIMEQLPAILWTTDASLNFTSVMGQLNDSQHPPPDVEQTSLFSFFQTDDPEFLPIAAHRAALQGKEKSYEMTWQDRHFQVHVEPFRDEKDNIIGCIGIALDISARIKAEVAARHMQKMESLGLMARGIAHDFNNLLTSMLVQGSLALVKTLPEAPARDHIRRMVNSAEQATNITKQILAFSGGNEIEGTIIDVNALIEDSYELLRLAIPKTVSLYLHLTQPLPPVEGDRGQLQQVLLNLVVNGAQAIGERSGDVVIETGFREVVDVSSSPILYSGESLAKGQYLVLTVSDTGSGMDADTMTRIFDPFFTTKQNGHGLGLATVLGIVSSHNGEWKVSSEPEKGTTFTFFFPVVQLSQPFSIPEAEVGKSGKVLENRFTGRDEGFVRFAE